MEDSLLMRIRELKLMNFRSYESLVLEPDEGLCVLSGDNAEGKTNILESIFLCALGRSHRTSRDAELIRYGQEEGSVRLVLDTRGGTRTIGCRLFARDRKKLSIDGAALSRSGELLGCLNVVMFAPEDLTLVKGGPGERRRFLDMEISQLKPSYYYTLQRYNTALKQRNALLKDPDHFDAAQVSTWDEQIAMLGSEIILDRDEFVDNLSGIAADMHMALSDRKEILLVSYEPDVPADDPDQLTETILEKLKANQEKDLARGYTSVGPHRDDVMLELDGTDVRIYGSQGQQRTTVLSLKLSELEIMRGMRDESPVLLLDDVFSELDRKRQELLLKAISECQTFLTCTHLEELVSAGVDRMQVYSVKNGTVNEI